MLFWSATRTAGPCVGRSSPHYGQIRVRTADTSRPLHGHAGYRTALPASDQRTVRTPKCPFGGPRRPVTDDESGCRDVTEWLPCSEQAQFAIRMQIEAAHAAHSQRPFITHTNLHVDRTSSPRDRDSRCSEGCELQRCFTASTVRAQPLRVVRSASYVVRRDAGRRCARLFRFLACS